MEKVTAKTLAKFNDVLFFDNAKNSPKIDKTATLHHFVISQTFALFTCLVSFEEMGSVNGMVPKRLSELA